MLVVIIIGGIYSGIFTATEAAAMGAVYAFFISVFVYRDLSLKDVPKVLLNSANLSAMLLYIITNAVLFSFLMAHENIPQAMGDWILARELGTTAFLLCVNAVLLLAGNVMDPSSIILIFAPILHPRHAPRHRHRALRDTDRRQHGSRPVPPAGRAQPLRRERHIQNEHDRPDHRRAAMARHHGPLPGDRHLLAGAVDVVAEGVGMM